MNHILFETITGIFGILSLHFYLDTLLDKQKELPVSLYWFWLILMYSLPIPVSDYFFGTYTTMKAITLSCLAFGTTFSATLVYKSSLRHRLFTAFMFILLEDICELLPAQLLLFLSRNFLSMDMEKIELMVQAQQAFWELLFISIIRIFYKKRGRQVSLKYSLALIITPLLSIFISESFYTTNDSNYFFHLSTIISTAMLFAINIINFVLLDSFTTINELEKKNAGLEQQIAYQANKYSQISSAYRSTRRILHDTKKHFFYIQECIKNGDRTHSIPYIKHAIEDLETTYNRINTGNLVIDSFLSSHMELAKSEGIRFITNLNVTDSLVPVKDYDLSVILGNLLDNALTECRKIHSPRSRFIRVEILTTETQFHIHVVNSSTPPDKNNTNEDLSYELYHGYGLENIRILTRKYFGSYDFRQESDTFDSAIMIPIINDQL